MDGLQAAEGFGEVSDGDQSARAPMAVRSSQICPMALQPVRETVAKVQLWRRTREKARSGRGGRPAWPDRRAVGRRDVGRVEGASFGQEGDSPPAAASAATGGGTPVGRA